LQADFLYLIDTAVREAECVRAECVRAEIASSGQYTGKLSSADLTSPNLASLRNLVVTDKLPRPSKGQVSNRASLGLSREVGEWTEDDRLLEASYAVEEYYRKSV
jgi:hypothetical protein